MEDNFFIIESNRLNRAIHKKTAARLFLFGLILLLVIALLYIDVPENRIWWSAHLLRDPLDSNVIQRDIVITN